MKITFIISNLGSKSYGNGGHYYSLIATVCALKKKHDIHVINIGSKESVAFINSGIDVVNIIDSGLNNFKLLWQLNNYIKTDQPNVIHAFDEFAYFYSRIVSVILKIPILLTKCGGGNPKYFYPLCTNFINYSKENIHFFKTKNKFNKSIIYLIPNRISDFESNSIRIQELREKYRLGEYDYIFLRIARIGIAYKNSIIQLINLINECNANNLKSCLLLVGTIESQTVVDEIKSNFTSNIFIESDKYVTHNAKELIDIADIVLGTGRSFMEAAIKGKIMLAPVNEGNDIVLVDKYNFEELFKTNFSERGQLKGFNKVLENQKIIKMLRSVDTINNLLVSNKSLFNNNFNIDYTLEKYNEIYSTMRFKFAFHIFDTFLNYLFLKLMHRALRQNNSQK